MPNPDSYLHFQGNIGALWEQPQSGAIDLDDRITKVNTYEGLYSLCLSVGLTLPKGTVGTGTNAGWQVLKTEIRKTKHRLGSLHVTWQSISWLDPLPADEFSCEPVEINPSLEKHPRYAPLTEAEVENVRAAIQASTDKARADSKAALSSLGLELLAKLARRQDSYYLAGIRYRWTSYWWTMPAMTPGGFVQTPGGPMAGFLPASMDFLRECDANSGGGDAGYLKLTRSWVGGPSGHWDTQIYT